METTNPMTTTLMWVFSSLLLTTLAMLLMKLECFPTAGAAGCERRESDLPHFDGVVKFARTRLATCA
jgi:hypothetical protein